jgi:hypothetical protein
MPGIVRRAVVWAAEKRLATGGSPALDTPLRLDIDDQNATDGARSVEWTTRIESDGAIEGGRSYHADVCRNGECLCRIALTGTFEDAMAHETLKARSGEWIAEFETRDRTGETGATRSRAA